jgi:hypothetical protein
MQFLEPAQSDPAAWTMSAADQPGPKQPANPYPTVPRSPSIQLGVPPTPCIQGFAQ